MSAAANIRLRRISAILLVTLVGVGLVPAAAEADPGCQSGGALVVWARGSGQSFRAPIFNAFYANVGNTLGSVPHQDVELGNEDGDFKLEPGEYRAVDIIKDRRLPAQYFESRELGANGLVNYLNRRAKRCPQEAFILGGFSQGADVVGDVILRQGYGSLSAQARNQIGVVAQYGDPSHFAGRGIFAARQRPQYLLKAGRIGSWCDVNDFYCNFVVGNVLGNSHGTIYTDRYIPDTSRWIAERAISKIGELRPPPASAPAPLPPPPSAVSPPPPPTVVQTYAQQQGRRGVDTFADHHSASGRGQRINPAQWVNVSCKVYDPSIASVSPDGYWYRIASAPWNDRYYAPANTFMNGDPWGGPFSHHTDHAVRDCEPGAPPAAPPSTPPPSAPPQPGEVTLTVYNKVTNGPSEMREDTPAYLSTVTRNYCKRDGCAVSGTDRNTGGTYAPAVCQVQGARTTNGHDGNANDDQNPGLFSSTRWYGIRLGTGSLGYISEVWIDPQQRGGLGLASC